MRILITGKNGQVGWELQRTMATLGEVIAVDRAIMDLSSPDSIRSVIREVKPNLIVNAAAYTAVDKAESEPELAMMINGIAPGIMAEEAKKLGATIIHYSTDYVFDGTKKEPYTEEDIPNPINVYGKTKLAGEKAVQAIGLPYFIFRTSWVYSTRGKNFLLTILRLAREKEQLKIVDDQIGSPTWSRTIAEMTAQILAQRFSTLTKGAGISSGFSGVYNLSAAGQTSWCGLASQIVANATHAASSKPGSKFAKILPIPATEYPVPAARPTNSVMSGQKLNAISSLQMPDWNLALSLCMQEQIES